MLLLLLSALTWFLASPSLYYPGLSYARPQPPKQARRAADTPKKPRPKASAKGPAAAGTGMKPNKPKAPTPPPSMEKNLQNKMLTHKDFELGLVGDMDRSALSKMQSGVGNIMAANLTTGLRNLDFTVQHVLLDIKNYMRRPSNDLGGAQWKSIMATFNPQFTATTFVEKKEVFNFKLNPSRSIFRMNWLVSAGTEPNGLKIRVLRHPQGHDSMSEGTREIYAARHLKEGFSAISAGPQDYGEYSIEIVPPKKGAVITLMLATDNVEDLGTLEYDREGAETGAKRLLREAQSLAKAIRLFGIRRSVHQEKISLTVNGIMKYSILLVFAAVMIASVGVLYTKQKVRKTLKCSPY